MRFLADSPNLEFLRRQAARLKARHRAGDASALATLRHYDTAFRGLRAEEIHRSRFSIVDAQRIIAREHGFASWTRLKRYVERCGTAPDPELRRLLKALEREGKDVIAEARRRYAAEECATVWTPRVIDQHRKNEEVLGELIERSGWPDPAAVGHAGLATAMIIVGDSSTSSALNRQAIGALGRAVDTGLVGARDLAVLTDRAEFLSGRKPVYGLIGDFDDSGMLSVGNDVRDPEHLDARRADAGIDSVASERVRMRTEAAKRGDDLRPDRERYYRHARELARIGGWIEA